MVVEKLVRFEDKRVYAAELWLDGSLFAENAIVVKNKNDDGYTYIGEITPLGKKVKNPEGFEIRNPRSYINIEENGKSNLEFLRLLNDFVIQYPESDCTKAIR